jgi:hypothetical protein
MKLPIALLTILLFSGVSCKNEKQEVTICNEGLLSGSTNFHSLILALPDYLIKGLTKNPNSSGALGRNLDGYFHVRFQMDIGFLASYAVYNQSDDALAKFISAAEYSFNKQKPSGDFELVIPNNLQYLGTPSEGDLTSGVAFFTSAVGSSLVLLNQSSWFSNRPNDALTQRLASLKTKFQLTVNYLKAQKEVLKMYDKDAPNRLFFDALAFYSMGIYLNDSQAKAIGIEFIELALAQQDAAGFFIEGGGFDSSYNGVSLRLGMVLLGILQPQNDLYGRLKKAISCSVQWQASRILESGEISLQGNARVYPGGESFLGSEKQMAWIDTLLSFYFTYALSSSENYIGLAKKVETFYN